MKIAFFVDAFPVLSETFIINQITGLIDRGHDVDIFAQGERSLPVVHPEIEAYRLRERVVYLEQVPKRGWRRIFYLGALLRDGGALRSVGRLRQILKILFSGKGANSFPKLVQLLLFLRQEKQGFYDIVHAQYGTLGRRLIPLKENGVLPGKHVISFRGHDVTQKQTWERGYYDELFAKGDRFLPVSESLKEMLVARGCDEARIRVLHSGINCDRFRFRPRSRSAGGPVEILTVARLVEMKGVIYGIEAVAGLLASGRSIRYRIAGDGPLRQRLESRISELGVAEHVHLLGWVDHGALTALMEESHLLLAPSVTAANGEQEGIPNVVKEAMAMGMPVVSTYHSGIPELVEEGVSGYLAPERDVERLEAVLAMLIDHPERWPAMGKAGREKVEADFDMESLNNELVSLYRSLLS